MGLTQRHGSEYSLSIGRATMQPIYDFIDMAQEQNKPFFVWYAPFHTLTSPHNPPKHLEEKYKKNECWSQNQVLRHVRMV